jgi:hypothetical protein
VDLERGAVIELHLARAAPPQDIRTVEGLQLGPPLVQAQPTWGMILVRNAPGPSWLPVSSTSSSYRSSSASRRMGSMGPECPPPVTPQIGARLRRTKSEHRARSPTRAVTRPQARTRHLETRPTRGLRSGHDDGVAGLQREVRALRAPLDQVEYRTWMRGPLFARITIIPFRSANSVSPPAIARAWSDRDLASQGNAPGFCTSPVTYTAALLTSRTMTVTRGLWMYFCSRRAMSCSSSTRRARLGLHLADHRQGDEAVGSTGSVRDRSASRHTETSSTSSLPIRYGSLRGRDRRHCLLVGTAAEQQRPDQQPPPHHPVRVVCTPAGKQRLCQAVAVPTPRDVPRSEPCRSR